MKYEQKLDGQLYRATIPIYQSNLLDGLEKITHCTLLPFTIETFLNEYLSLVAIKNSLGRDIYARTVLLGRVSTLGMYAAVREEQRKYCPWGMHVDKVINLKPFNGQSAVVGFTSSGERPVEDLSKQDTSEEAVSRAAYIAARVKQFDLKQSSTSGKEGTTLLLSGLDFSLDNMKVANF